MIKSEFLLCVEGEIITRLKSINVNEAATNTHFALPPNYCVTMHRLIYPHIEFICILKTGV